MNSDQNPIMKRSAAFVNNLLLPQDKTAFQNLNEKLIKKFQEKVNLDGIPQNNTLAKRVFDELYLSKDQAVKLSEQGKLIDPLRAINNCPNDICEVPFDLTAIWNFGCWCNFGSNLMMGNSKPVDEVDKLCRDMQLCLRCARWDAKQVGDVCDPVTQTWTGVSGPNFVFDCVTENAGDKCAQNSCCCEADFLAGLIGLVFQSPPYVQDTNFLVSNGFDRDLNCPIGGPGMKEHACCGTYPDRFPYGIARKGCCMNKKLYPLATHDCCPDGTTQPMGMC